MHGREILVVPGGVVLIKRAITMALANIYFCKENRLEKVLLKRGNVMNEKERNIKLNNFKNIYIILKTSI